MHVHSEWLAKHPMLVGLAFALLTGWGAYNAFQGGIHFAAIRDAVADRAREASEALGG